MATRREQKRRSPGGWAIATANRDSPDARSATHRCLAAVIVLVGAAAYYNSFSGVFLFDDVRSIVEQDRLLDASAFWGQWVRDRRPMVWLSLGLNHAAGGLNVWGYHLFNLGVHVLAGLTLYGLIYRTLLTGRLGASRVRTATAWAAAVALLWVVHPLQTQAVTYIIQRGESMMGLFYLLTLYFIVRGATASHARVWYAGAVAACLMGMGSKAVMITAPIVVLLYDGVFLSGSVRRALRERWGLYVGLAATWGALITTGVAQGVLHPVPGRVAAVGFGYKGLSPLEYALTQPGVLLHYLRLSFWPDRLCLDYGWPAANTVGAIVWPGLVIVGLLIATLWGLWRRPPLGFLGAWFFLILAPTSSFIPIRDAAFEHRMYLPLAAVIALSVAAASWLLGRVSAWALLSASGARRLRIALLAVVVACLGTRTVVRNRDYHSEAGMWRAILRQHPRYARAYLGLGASLIKRGRIDEGALRLEQAVRIDPNYADAQFNLGNVRIKQGRYDEARKHLSAALRAKPGHARAHNDLGVLLAQQGRFDEGIRHLREAIRLKPRSPQGHYNLTRALELKGRIAEAVAEGIEALRLSPDRSSVIETLAVLLARRGRIDEAFTANRDVKSMGTVCAKAYVIVGDTRRREGDLHGAVDAYRRALGIDAQNATARARLDAIDGEHR